MKKIATLLLALSLLMLSACGGSNSDGSTIESTAPIDAPHEVPEETCSAIVQELREYFYGFDENSTVSVSDHNGALDISLYYVGMVLRVPFPDYANALSIQAKELAEEYGEDIYRIRVQFTGGQGKTITGDSYDGISWDLTDTYEDAISLSSQTIDDLVERYGCMDWFYKLSAEDKQNGAVNDDSDNSSTGSDDEEFLPTGPVGGNGSFSLDSIIDILSSESDSEVAYDPDANCIVTIMSADGIIQGFVEKYVNDPDSAIERWETSKSTYLSLDNAYRKLIAMCDSEVETMFVLVDNEQENRYVLMIQNGELTHCFIDDFIESQDS